MTVFGWDGIISQLEFDVGVFFKVGKFIITSC
jgi:hypothetical protein